jgi:hypothetical protein
MRRLALGLALAAATAAAAPPAGRYAATLCVATAASAPPDCGAAEFDLGSNSTARLRVADIVYRLQLRPGQLDVTTVHGRVQVDEFSAPYAWRDRMLSFVDTEKGVRYEVTVGAKQGAPR